MKKLFMIIAVGALALCLLTACADPLANTEESVADASSSTESTPSSQVTEAKIGATDYDAAAAITLSPDDDLTITEVGVYILSGTYKDTMVVIDAGDEDKVQLVLDNATLTNENGPAIFVRNADKVFITAAEGTVNAISDGSDYSLTDGDTELDAAVFSKDDLTLNGAGELTINGNYKHGVVSKDDLVVKATDFTVNAVNVGLNGKVSVSLSTASVSITAGSDGIRSDNDTEADRGTVSIVDSVVSIVSGKDGIQAETVFEAENATITILAGGGSNAVNSDDTESYKGVKASVSITIDGGSYQIDAYDDAVHTNGTILISGGTFSIQSRDDGLHADERIDITGGTFDITAYEGIEATYVCIRGGDITIEASDDGINASQKSSAYTPTVEISGGTVTVTMAAGDTDGIDSNGDIIISGGTISVNANSSFDYDGSASFTGGTVYVNGQQVTTLPNQMMGGPGGGPGGFGGFGGPGGQP